MPCPHSGVGPPRDSGDDSRREFMKAAVAIGGMSALSACATLTDTEVEGDGPQFPQGSADPETLPDRQHGWNDYLTTDRHNDTAQPRHQVYRFLEYQGKGTPTAAERETVETALRTLERAFQRGTGGEPNEIASEGLLFTIGYARVYFERFQKDRPESVDLPSPEAVLEELEDDPAKADPYDAFVHLGSDQAPVILAAEEALFGNLDRLNGVEVEADLTGILEPVARRAGVLGRGLPARHIDDEDIPEQADASMGFKSYYGDTQPGEDRITIETGPFAGGTTHHVSRLELDLESWYDQPHTDRVEKMYSPEHTSDQVGEVGEGLAGNSRMTPDLADRTKADAAQRGRVGHSQKLARARDEEFVPRILRRGDFNAPAEPGAVLHFGSLQTGISDFVETRQAMTLRGADDGTDQATVNEEDDGILSVIEVTNRANFLLPPRSLRALPPARP